VATLKIYRNLAIFWKNNFIQIPIDTKQWHWNSIIFKFILLTFLNLKNVHFQMATIHSYFWKKCQKYSNHPQRHRPLNCTSLQKHKYMTSGFCYGLPSYQWKLCGICQWNSLTKLAMCMSLTLCSYIETSARPSH